jgi:hypothetical protein
VRAAVGRIIEPSILLVAEIIELNILLTDPTHILNILILFIQNFNGKGK